MQLGGASLLCKQWGDRAGFPGILGAKPEENKAQEAPAGQVSLQPEAKENRRGAP